MFVPISAAMSKPSKASPPLRDPSPITATIFSFPPRMSRAFCNPVAKATDVEVCPISKQSYSGDSSGELYPDTSSKRLLSKYP